jgi:hypothetical protein
MHQQSFVGTESGKWKNCFIIIEREREREREREGERDIEGEMERETERQIQRDREPKEIGEERWREINWRGGEKGGRRREKGRRE